MYSIRVVGIVIVKSQNVRQDMEEGGAREGEEWGMGEGE